MSIAGTPLRTLAFLLILLSLPAFAGEVYKCKAADGSVTFTNVKCPEKAQAQHYGSYQAAEDSPDQYFQAAEEADRIRSARGEVPQTVPGETHEDERMRQSDWASAVMRDARSTAGRQQIRDDANSQGAKVAKYREDVKRWGKRMAGEPPPGYVAPQQTRRATPPPKPPVMQTCNPTGGGTVTCFGNDGSISNGHVDQDGRGTMFGSDGSIRQMQGMPNRAGSCVVDINGFCQ